MPIDAAWEKLFQSREWGTQPHKSVIVMLMRHFYWSARKTIKILDMGCGFGANTWYCAAEGYDTYAIDGSKTALDRARANVKKAKANAHFDHGDLSAMSYADNTFDMVIDVAAISCNNFADSMLIYKEAHRVMKPGGLMYTQCFAPGTDPAVFAPETYNRISDWEEMCKLIAEFDLVSYDQALRCVPSDDKIMDIVEWMLGVKKK
jgi:SAM-dependent methyltransferase